MLRVLFILGTRPEAIKLAPLIAEQKSQPGKFDVRVCLTGQHADMVRPMLELFDVTPDFDLDVMKPRQTLCETSARILAGLEKCMAAVKPDLSVVQGDTTTTLCGALASFYQRVPVAHVEAGLRTGDLGEPFPEEMNRRLATRMTTLHFAPTVGARRNLLEEGCRPSSVWVTGNTGVDAVLAVYRRIASGKLPGCEGLALDPNKKLIFVTAHRRENFGRPLENICSAVVRLAKRSDVQIVLPVHPNPDVRRTMVSQLSSCANVLMVDPLSYTSCVDLMSRAYLIMTDSGGIQEEAPSLGTPVLLLRNKTERMEAAQAGRAIVAGTATERILSEATKLLDDSQAHRAMARPSTVYGDGRASQRICERIWNYFDKESQGIHAGQLEHVRSVLAGWTRRFVPADAPVS